MKDTIYRQDAINAIDCDIVITGRKNAELVAETIAMFADRIKSLPFAEPEIIYCKDCKKHNMQHNHYYHGKYIGVKECCPLIFVRGLAQGHEFDYQFCVYGERRANEGHDL